MSNIQLFAVSVEDAKRYQVGEDTMVYSVVTFKYPNNEEAMPTMHKIAYTTNGFSHVRYFSTRALALAEIRLLKSQFGFTLKTR